MKEVITIENLDLGQFFFTSDHCQPHNLGESWVSITQYHTTKDKVKTSNEDPINKWATMVEIPNPQPEYQA